MSKRLRLSFDDPEIELDDLRAAVNRLQRQKVSFFERIDKLEKENERLRSIIQHCFEQLQKFGEIMGVDHSTQTDQI